jgi:acetyl esterase/lipase
MLHEDNAGVLIGGMRIPIVILSADGELVGRPMILFLGGATIGAEKSMPLLEPTAELGVASVATFDYRGMTPETREFAAGLCTRLEDAHVVAVYLRLTYRPSSLILWGHSMGGYLVAHMLASAQPQRVILTSPAAYDERAMRESILFGPDFHALNNAAGSWGRSDGPALFANFPGGLLVLIMENDEVVPRAIPDAYIAGATRANERLRMTLPFGHKGTFDQTPAGKRKRELMLACLRWWLA